MKNLFQWIYKKFTVSIVGAETIEADGTDILIASGDQTPSAAGSITLATIAVPVGTYCVVGDVDFFTNNSSGGVLVVSYVDPISTKTVTRYLAIAAAGTITSEHDFKDRPFVAMFNPVSSGASVDITLTTTAVASQQYIADAAYVLRYP